MRRFSNLKRNIMDKNSPRDFSVSPSGSRSTVRASPEEGVRLMKAFTAIEDRAAREAVIKLVEILALRSRSARLPN